MVSMEYLLHKLNRNIGKSNSLQIIVLAIAIHSCVSIVMIYVHLVYYFDTHFSKHHSEHNHSNVGKIAFITSDQELPLNLIHNDIIKSNNISDMGWFSDHSKWKVSVNCFNNHWSLCSQILSTKCKADRSRAMYQFIPIRHDFNLYDIGMSLRATADQLQEQSNEAFYGMIVLIKFEDNSQEIIRLQFTSEVELWTKRKHRFHNKFKKRIESITVMITCFGYSGSVSFTDIRVSPIAENSNIETTDRIGRWCHNSYKPVDTNVNLKFEKIVLSLAPIPKSRVKSDVTFVTQLSMDRLIVLERSLQSWVGPVSIVIFIPVKNRGEGIQEWHSHVNLVSGLESDDYPINSLRNVAIKHVKTKFMFISDADFQPCPD
ncbi:unnamed protein product [Oppiella nova]|uniref:Hexosyltransferase n=1 Tax=Oppiella nova TaxID=334625 RepID=A0A7R9LTX0_9ACAR|nr:unnamed protein product [Oppiella nova]CAG2166615.1 unnamed protein product [Oppiella nova]